MIFGLAACQDEADSRRSDVVAPEPPAPPATEVPAAAPAGGARQVVEETDTFRFEYSYPLAAGQLPDLANLLDLQLEELRNGLAIDAAQGREDASDSGFPFNKYSSATAWEVVAELPGWLSLSADFSSYTGGAHPNYGFDTLVWDKAANVAVEPIDLFTSATALDGALGQDLCDQLNLEREKRRGSPVPEGSDDIFDSCVKVDETNVLLGSKGGDRFDRIGIQVAPYLAGPYAEGSYEFTFPMTAQLLEIVRPEYRAAFTARN